MVNAVPSGSFDFSGSLRSDPQLSLGRSGTGIPIGKNWKRLHKTVYLASILVVLHYAWAVKGSLANLSGDILRPLSMGLLVAILLVLRIPAVRRRLARAR